jgi:hypothetical protein
MGPVPVQVPVVLVKVSPLSAVPEIIGGVKFIGKFESSSVK